MIKKFVVKLFMMITVLGLVVPNSVAMAQDSSKIEGTYTLQNQSMLELEDNWFNLFDLSYLENRLYLTIDENNNFWIDMINVNIAELDNVLPELVTQVTFNASLKETERDNVYNMNLSDYLLTISAPKEDVFNILNNELSLTGEEAINSFDELITLATDYASDRRLMANDEMAMFFMSIVVDNLIEAYGRIYWNISPATVADIVEVMAYESRTMVSSDFVEYVLEYIPFRIQKRGEQLVMDILVDSIIQRNPYYVETLNYSLYFNQFE